MAQNAYWGGNVVGLNQTPQQIINNSKWKNFNLQDWTKNKLNEKDIKTPTTKTNTNTNNKGWGTKTTTTKKTTPTATPAKVERDLSMYTPESIANYQAAYDYQIGKGLSDAEAHWIASGFLEEPQTKPTTTQPKTTKTETPKVETPKVEQKETAVEAAMASNKTKETPADTTSGKSDVASSTVKEPDFEDTNAIANEDVEEAYSGIKNWTAETDTISDESTVTDEGVNNVEMANSENFDELMGNYGNKDEDELNNILSEVGLATPETVSYSPNEATSYESILEAINSEAATPATDTVESSVVPSSTPLTDRDEREYSTRVNVNERTNDYDDWYGYPEPQYIDDTYVDETIYDVGDTINDYEDNIKNPFEIKKKEWPLTSRGWYDTTRIGRH